MAITSQGGCTLCSELDTMPSTTNSSAPTAAHSRMRKGPSNSSCWAISALGSTGFSRLRNHRAAATAYTPHNTATTTSEQNSQVSHWKWSWSCAGSRPNTARLTDLLVITAADSRLRPPKHEAASRVAAGPPRARCRPSAMSDKNGASMATRPLAVGITGVSRLPVRNTPRLCAIWWLGRRSSSASMKR